MSNTNGGGPRPAKRLQILNAARDLFLGAGFEATSMDEITQVAGVSKATLYNHFASKEVLFAEVMRAKYEQLAEQLGEIDPEMPPEEGLSDFACRLISIVTTPDHIALVRAIIGVVASNPEVSEAYFAHGKSAAFRALGGYLVAQVEKGTFQIDDVYLAGMQFLGAIKEPLLWPLVFGGAARGEVDDVIERAVRMSLAEWQAGLA